MPDFSTQLLQRDASLREATRRLQDYMSRILRDERVLFHTVVGRTKDVKSAIRKQAKKKYADPWAEMTDIVAARVFTYFRADSVLVEAVLRKHFDVDEEKSLNKADGLDQREFGYTSRHLILSVGEKTQDIQLRGDLEGISFEVQIRTVLEHGWAEVEHELVYKAGTIAPGPIHRRFAATAASLELIESEFAQLRTFEWDMIRQRVEILAAETPEEGIDRAWFIAALEVQFPDRDTWSSNPKEDIFYHGLELQLLDVLKESDAPTVKGWCDLLGSANLIDRIELYCLIRGLDATTISHLPIAILACAPLDLTSDDVDVIDEALELASVGYVRLAEFFSEMVVQSKAMVGDALASQLPDRCFLLVDQDGEVDYAELTGLDLSEATIAALDATTGTLEFSVDLDVSIDFHYAEPGTDVYDAETGLTVYTETLSGKATLQFPTEIVVDVAHRGAKAEGFAITGVSFSDDACFEFESTQGDHA